MKKILFLLMGIGLSVGFFASVDLNAMNLRDILNDEDLDPARVADFRAARVPVGRQFGGAAPVRGIPAMVAPVVRAPAVGVPVVAAPAAVAAPAINHVNRQRLIYALTKIITAPWELGSKITSMIGDATTNVEPAAKVFMRCVLEGVFCGIALHLASADSLGDSATRRFRLANFAYEDLFSSTQFHYTCSKLWTLLYGLQYFGAYLGLSGLRLYAWGFGVVIGLRCAYDSFVKLPLSLLYGRNDGIRRVPYRYDLGLD